jgi:hypothetical protein
MLLFIWGNQMAFMAFFEFLLNNLIFKVVLAFCTILAFILAIIALIPATRSKFFFKRNIKVKEQEIIGTNNFQAGGDIQLNKKPIKDSVDFHQSLLVESQTIRGDNNKQAGGDINA